jgi:pimeloyl-ACP methyl ester carboxylesterase
LGIERPRAQQSPAVPLSRKSFLGLSASGFHRVSYTEWGDPQAAHVVICVHGLTRNARDFDTLAQALAPYCRVLCPDVVGRGQSDWLARKEDYAYPQYLADMTALIARASAGLPPAARIDWVGTSMGGLIGIALAAQPGHPIGRLVLNDVGPFVPKAALERLALYVGKAPRFPSFADAERYVRVVSASFGPLTDAQWRHLTEHNTRREDDGCWVMNYDPGIAHTLTQSPPEDISLWPLWDRIDCPTLVIRGERSDVLLRATADEMLRRRPGTRLLELPGIGHAPALMDPAQVDAILRFLLEPRPDAATA